MNCGKLYRVTKRIKLHTKPLVEADIVQIGEFLKDAPKQLIFRNFRVSKANVISVQEL